MTFLQLCQRLGQEAAIGNRGNPASVLNQTGEEKRIVDWISTAYEDVQNLHPDWKFLQTDFSLSLSSGTNTYASSLVSNFGSWRTTGADSFRVYLTATGVSDEQWIDYIPWEDFRTAYVYGTNRTQTGRPTLFSIKPDDTVIFWPTPDASYTCVGEYYITPDIMTANADEPIIPARFHMVLVWGGLMMYGMYSAEPDKYAFGEDRYEKILRKLETDQLPAMGWGDTLA